MISASFKLSRKLPVTRHSLKRLRKVSAEVLQLTFNILGGIVFLLVAFLVSIFRISFSCQKLIWVGTTKSVWFCNLLFIIKMLGWNLYLQIVLSTGSERLSESLLIIYLFLLIFKFETAFLKKVFNSSATFWSSCNNSLSSTNCTFEKLFPLFEKKGFQKKVYYVSQMMDLDYWKFFFLFFYSWLEKLFCFLKAFKDFSLRL